MFTSFISEQNTKSNELSQNMNTKLNLSRIYHADNVTGKYIQFVIDENNVIQLQTFASDANRIGVSIKNDGEWGDVIILTS